MSVFNFYYLPFTKCPFTETHRGPLFISEHPAREETTQLRRLCLENAGVKSNEKWRRPENLSSLFNQKFWLTLKHIKKWFFFFYAHSCPAFHDLHCWPNLLLLGINKCFIFSHILCLVIHDKLWAPSDYFRKRGLWSLNCISFGKD